MHIGRPCFTIDFETLASSWESGKHFNEIFLANVPMLDQIFQLKCLDSLVKDILSDLLKFDYWCCTHIKY
jgi:hypothetical protein